MKKFLSLFCSSLLGLLFLCPAKGQTQYTVVKLNLGFIPRLVPVKINNGGRVIGTYYWRDNSSHSFTYKDGVINDLGTLPGFTNVVTSINNYGVIVGYYEKGVSFDPNVIRKAYVREPTGKTTLLGSLDDALSTIPQAINDCGVIVGSSGENAFVYRNGKMFRLGSFQGHPLFVANGINQRGQIVALYRSDTDIRTVLYSCGHMQDIQALGAETVQGVGLNDHGAIIGRALKIPGEQPSVHNEYYFVYANGQSTSLQGRPTGINNSEQISGYLYYYLDGETPATFGPGGQLLDGLFFSLGITYFTGVAADINDSGQIIGYGYGVTAEFPQVALLLTPVK